MAARRPGAPASGRPSGFGWRLCYHEFVWGQVPQPRRLRVRWPEAAASELDRMGL